MQRIRRCGVVVGPLSIAHHGLYHIIPRVSSQNYFTLRPFAALASPLPRVPRSPPRAAPPLPAAGTMPPRLGSLDGAGVENLGVCVFEEVGGLSTNDVSVVLSSVRCISHKHSMAQLTRMLSRHHPHHETSLNS